MSVGEVGGGRRDDAAEKPSERFDDELQSEESVRFSWTATGVRWANESIHDVSTPTTFAATDRRILFETDESVASIGYDRMRAVKTSPAAAGFDVSTAFLASGGLCLVVGVVVALQDFTNGAGLVVLSIALLAVGAAIDDTDRAATVTIVIGNERQRLSFAADEDVGPKLSGLVD
ncbi:hypothetical protein [Halorussus marinus]|uniref:hypothetical protein n=1 Tax=Halorussus marinus TaxID=2505976 RepID=UPI00106E8312|nr:hypothetical protein [Halorussus marinus]